MKQLFIHIALVACLSFVFLSSCTGRQSKEGFFTSEEKSIVMQSPEVMYVLDVSDPVDEVILRTPCEDYSNEELQSETFSILARKMLSTVQSPQQGGVGIAAPQVGISKKVIAVCRVDKEGEPFEIYPNVTIDQTFGEPVSGPEGCLSIPPYRGQVKRFQKIAVSFTDPSTLERKQEVVEGYAAVIFQHEIDHLSGVLYTDKADTVYVNQSWIDEREPYSKAGLYDKPEWIVELLNR